MTSTRRPRLALLATTVALTVALVTGPAAAGAPRLQCPDTSDKPTVYAIGSSTMGSILGDVLKKELKSWGVRFRFWGKASSGLARPDFHDWPAQTKRINRRDPDVILVSLGTNDGQALYYEVRKGKRKRKRWAELGTPEWRERYAARVDALLEGLSGPDRSRPIVWLGPTAHPTPRFNKRMRAIRDVIAERIAAFDGPAVFLDGLALTLDPKTKRPKRRAKRPGRKGTVRALQPDGLHLTAAGARWLLAAPIFDQLAPCFAPARESAH